MYIDILWATRESLLQAMPEWQTRWTRGADYHAAQLPQQQQHVLPQGQTAMQQSPSLEAQGTVPFICNLSNEADDDNGDLYELCGSQIPPPYAHHDAYGQPLPVPTPLG